MNDVFKIFKKEMDKIFRFPRMIFTSLLLPGLIIFVIYALIGQSLEAEMNETEEYIGSVQVINAPDSMNFAFNNENAFHVDLEESLADELTLLIDQVKDGTIDALVVYPENFDADVANELDPEILIYFDSSNTKSSITYSYINIIINVQQNNFLEALSIDPNLFVIDSQSLAEESEVGAMILSMLLPMLIISFIFAGALSIGSDAIAGEKERGTLATLLMAPLSRTKVILGKIISTAVLTIFSALSSFVGIIASLPFQKPCLRLKVEA